MRLPRDGVTFSDGHWSASGAHVADMDGIKALLTSHSIRAYLTVLYRL
jgi:hypothetical protein